jgi:hypothetical protein
MPRRRQPYPSLYGKFVQVPKPAPKPPAKKQPPPGPVYAGTNLARAVKQPSGYGRIPGRPAAPKPAAKKPVRAPAFTPYPRTNLPAAIRRPSPYGRQPAPAARAPRGPKGLTPGQIARGVHMRGPKGMTPGQIVARVQRPKTGTAATIPPHALTPAVRSTHAASSSAVAKAQAQRGRPPRIGIVPVGPKPRPGARPPAARGTTTPTTTATSGDSDIATLINSILGPQYAAIDQAVAREQEVNRQNLATYQGLTQSYLNTIRSLPANVSADYGAMMDQTTRMAAASADRLAAASPNADVQALLQAVGAPESQQQQLATQAQNIFQGGGAVLAHTQGTIPGQTLARVGAAQTAYAHELPAVVAARGIQGLQGLQYAFGQNLQDLYAKRAAVAGQVPKLTLDIREQQRADYLKRRALEIEAKGFGLKAATARAGIARGKAETKQGWARIGIAAATAKTAAARAARSDEFRYAEVYGYNPRTGQPTLAAIKAARADKAKGTKPPSATQRKNWTTFADQAYHGVAPKTHYDTGTGTFIRLPGTGQPPIQYYPALKRLISMGATLSQAQQTLNALYAKGEGGRPYVSLQGRIALSNAGMPLPAPMNVPTARQKAYLQRHGLWSD